MEQEAIPRLLSTLEVSRKLGCKETTVRRWIREDRIKFSFVSGKYMIFASEISRIINEGVGRKTTAGRKPWKGIKEK